MSTTGVFSWHGTRERFAEAYQLCIGTPHGLFFLPTIRGWVFSEFAICLGALYTLSVLARYHPNLWLRTVEDDRRALCHTLLHAHSKNESSSDRPKPPY